MHAIGLTRCRAQFRTLFHGALMALVALVLAACSAGSILTDSASPGGGEPKGKPVPPVAYQEITGIPPAKLAQLKGALTSAGGLHDIAFVEGSFGPGVFSVSGRFQAAVESDGVRIVYQWQFRDADGVLIDNIDGEDNAGVFAGTDPWAGVSAAVLDRIARRTADTMARKLSQMGFATRLAQLTAPPAELFAKADPGAAREIDFETVHGPGMGAIGAAMLVGADQVVVHEDVEPTVAVVAPLKGEGLMPRVAFLEEPAAAPPPSGDAGLTGASDQPPAAETSPAAAPSPDAGSEKKAAAPPKKAKPGQQEIRAVAVVPVKGSPASGDAELTAAMRKTLSAAGWPVVSKPQPDALTIAGKVKLADKGEAQSVSVRWEVRTPDGKTLGEVKQANDIPKGALDGGWGPAAMAVAEAAAPGIYDIVKRFQ